MNWIRIITFQFTIIASTYVYFNTHYFPLVLLCWGIFVFGTWSESIVFGNPRGS